MPQLRIIHQTRKRRTYTIGMQPFTITISDIRQHVLPDEDVDTSMALWLVGMTNPLTRMIRSAFMPGERDTHFGRVMRIATVSVSQPVIRTMAA